MRIQILALAALVACGSKPDTVVDFKAQSAFKAVASDGTPYTLLLNYTRVDDFTLIAGKDTYFDGTFRTTNYSFAMGNLDTSWGTAPENDFKNINCRLDSVPGGIVMTCDDKEPLTFSYAGPAKL